MACDDSQHADLAEQLASLITVISSQREVIAALQSQHLNDQDLLDRLLPPRR